MRWAVRGTLALSQNGSELYHSDATLTHYGVKGMKWGIRKDPISTGKQNRAIQKVANSNRQNGPVARAPSTSSSNTRKNSNRLNSAFGQADSNGVRHVTNPKTGEKFDVTISRKQNSRGVNYYDINVGKTSSLPGGYSRAIYDGDSTDAYVQLLMKAYDCSEEEAKDYIKEFDKNFDENEAAQAAVDKAKNEDNPFKNYKSTDLSKAKTSDFSKAKTSNLKTDKTLRQKVADGAKAVGNAIKNVGKQVASAASKAVNAGKNALKKLLNVKDSPTKTTRASDKPTSKTNQKAKTTSGIGAYIPKNAGLRPTKQYKDLNDWKKKNGGK